MSRLTYLLGLAALLIPSTLFAADFSGPVVRILDGDTIEVLHNSRPERIRLSGIDCLEKGQAYGQKAKQVASDLRSGQVRAHTRRCIPARWHERQSRAG